MELLLEDETLARHRDMGAVCHRVIAAIAARTRTPDPCTIASEVAAALPQLSPNEGRAHRQNIIGSVTTYFRRLLPPPGWAFHGSEVRLGAGRVDLLWQRDRRLVLDEIKTGNPAFFGTSAHQQQGREYLRASREVHGHRVAGLRLLCLNSPDHSLYLVDPALPYAPLGGTRPDPCNSRARSRTLPGGPPPPPLPGLVPGRPIRL